MECTFTDRARPGSRMRMRGQDTAKKLLGMMAPSSGKVSKSKPKPVAKFHQAYVPGAAVYWRPRMRASATTQRLDRI